jgi:domain of unknown function (DUF1814)
MQKFTSINQMKSYMKKEAKRLNMSVSSVYSTFVARCLLKRISKYNLEDILIKGSSAEIAYLGRVVRAITDIDLASLTSFESNIELLTNILEDEFPDQFKFQLSKEVTTTKTGIHKISLNANYETLKQNIGIDYQEHYNRLIEPEYRVMPAIFDGDDLFEVYVPSFEEYLAEKLCIIVESNKEDVLNTRVKDFYDIYQLHGGRYNPDKLTEYFKKMIELRGKISFSQIKTLNLNEEFVHKHATVWDSTKKHYDFIDQEIDLAGAVYYTRAVIREQLQKNGKEMEDNISYQYKR